MKQMNHKSRLIFGAASTLLRLGLIAPLSQTNTNSPLFLSSAAAASVLPTPPTTTTTTTATASTVLPLTSAISSSPRILLPRDVYFDSETREHLDLISDSYEGQDEDEEEDKDKDGSPQQRLLQNNNAISAALQALSSSGNIDRVTLTMTGYKGGRLEDQINQDRALIVNPLLLSSSSMLSANDEDQQDDTVVSPSMLMGVLDGHGDPGHRVSEFARVQLEQRLTAALQRDASAVAPNANDETKSSSSTTKTLQLLKNTTYISNLVTQIMEQINRDLPAPHGINGGSTVSLVLQLGEHVYLINLGDSQSFLAATTTAVAAIPTRTMDDASDGTSSSNSNTMKTATVILQMTVPDKPGRPDERARIEAAGGVIEQPHANDEDTENNARLSYYIGTAGYSLAMSRCLGDHPATGLIATPTIQVFTMRELLAQAKDMLGNKLLVAAPTTSSDPKGQEDDTSNLQPLLEQQEQICVDNGDGNSNADGECKAPSDMTSAADTSPTTMIDAKDIHLFAVSASDGLLDFVHNQQIADQMGRALYLAARPSPPTLPFPFTAAEQLILLSANRWHQEFRGRYRDDIALAVATLHPPSTTDDR